MGKQVSGLAPVRGGMISRVFWATLADGEAFVVKHDASATARRDTEEAMLRYPGHWKKGDSRGVG